MICCDKNTSADSWTFKGSTATSSVPTGQLLRLLFLRQCVRMASSLIPLHVADKDNEMADIPSWAFKSGEFFHVQENLTLPQPQSLIQYKVHTKLASRVISCLRSEPLQMESLLKLPGLEKRTGKNGRLIVRSALQTHLSQTTQSTKHPSLSLTLQPGCGPALTVKEEIKSRFKQSQMRSRPSPRPQNWLDNQVPSTKQRRENILFPSNT